MPARPTKKTTRKSSPKKTTKRPAKKSSPKKPRSNKKMELSAKQQEVVKFLKAKGATSATHGIDRKLVWEKCDVGFGPIAKLKKAGLMCRADMVDGTKEYFLTKLGVAVSMR